MNINFQDPRVQKRSRQCMDFAINYFGNKTRPASRNLLNEHFGKSNNPVSQYLRQIMLIVVDEHYNMATGKCKTYKINIQGLNYVDQVLAGTYTNSFKEYCLLAQSHSEEKLKMRQLDQSKKLIEKHKQEIRTGRFRMSKKSQRSHHPLQNIPSLFRAELFAQEGYRYDYDIQCCAPTLLVQLARKKGMTKPTPACDLLLADRKKFREEISVECSIDPKQTKQIINALFQGGKLSTHYSCELYTDLLEYNAYAIHRLQRSDLLCQLRKEISMMWRYIGKDIPRGLVELKSGKLRRRALTPRMKAQIYRELESCVRTHIERYLRREYIRFLFEHDGWRCDQLIDMDCLIHYVRSRAGYNIRLDMSKI